MIPDRDRLTICFAHVAYQLQERFARRNTGLRSLEVRTREALAGVLGEADVLVISGLWPTRSSTRRSASGSSSRSAPGSISSLSTGCARVAFASRVRGA